jgi:hypothetical protein
VTVIIFASGSIKFVLAEVFKIITLGIIIEYDSACAERPCFQMMELGLFVKRRAAEQGSEQQ